jgi:transposase
MQIRELLRYLRASSSDRAVQRDTGLHRKTIKRYRQWAAEHQLLDGPLPSLEELQVLVEKTLKTPQPTTPLQPSTVEPYREQVESFHAKGLKGRAIWQRLKEQGYTGSVSSVYRFVAHLERQQAMAKGLRNVTVRVERPPGEEAQVDFGSIGLVRDEVSGKLREGWVFVMTLSYSRHMYVEFVFRQDSATWLELHRRAFEWFGGVPKRVVLDNLKAAIQQTSWDGTDPLVNISYRECAEHYGFLIAPCRPRKPEHKGKVENTIAYIKGNLLAGRELKSLTLTELNRLGRQWCLEVAGQRIHGTTKHQPLALFEIEKAHLLALPAAPFEMAEWKELKVHRDCYLTFDHAFYSVPFRLVGQKVRVRGSRQKVRIFTTDYQPVATHTRALSRGERLTHPDHLPSTKLAGLTRRREEVLEKAQSLGPATTQVVERLLEDRVVDRLHAAGKVVQLAQKAEIGPARLEAACQRALTFGETSYLVIRRILTQGLEAETILPVSSEGAVELKSSQNKAGTLAETEPGLSPGLVAVPPSRYARSAQELLGHLFRGSVALVGLVSTLAGGLWN